MEKLLIDLIFLNSKSSFSHTYEVDNVPIKKKGVYNITSYITVSNNSEKKLNLVWMIERKYGKYKIIDLRFHNTNFSDFLKVKLNVNSDNIRSSDLIANTKLYLFNLSKIVNLNEKNFVFLIGKFFL